MDLEQRVIELENNLFLLAQEVLKLQGIISRAGVLSPQVEAVDAIVAHLGG